MPAPSADARRVRGEYFTPPPLVEAVLSRALPYLGPGPLTVVDPACGDGAFLAAAARALPRARLHGLELDAGHAASTRRAVPAARILVGDALRDGWDALVRPLPADGQELWLGNPPYNGTSPLLRDPAAYRALRARLGLDDALPPGTSLRDDYAFFLLLASERLARRPGVLAWVTSATLLDAFLYAPLRRRMLERLSLREVVDLGAGVFPGARVRTCITVWRSRDRPEPSPRFRAWTAALGPLESVEARPFRIHAPEWSLRPVSEGAERLDARWRAAGEPLDVLVPISCTGLKTRFDELLVDDDPDRLVARVDAFLQALDLRAFARAHGLAPRLLPKLEALRRTPGLPARAERLALRPFHRWAGARGLPPGEHAHCYLDRRLIPRGDHRLVGAFDPHAGDCKLVFNVRELPLAAALLEAPGCIPAHRHTRFAPLMIPERIRTEGPRAGRSGTPLGPLVPNLSPAGLAWAERGGGPGEVFRHIARFIRSPEVQEVWAPAFGRTRVLPVPVPLARARGRG
ncbi:MAG TPA: N-6 DNA methylase [Myxococcaceae bacterium]|nr:N-6 DNA methylase [Myxococcaceae bacterium]